MTLVIGMLCFGLMIGFITYRTLVRTTEHASINDLAAVVAAVGGGAVTAIVRPQTSLFGWYAIGLFVGFVAYGCLFAYLNKGNGELAKVLGQRDDAPGRIGGPNAPRGGG